MAKSQLKNSRGLNIKPKKKRDKSARASITLTDTKDGKTYTRNVSYKNDGDPTNTYKYKDKRNPKRNVKTTVSDPAAANPVKGRKRILGIPGTGAKTEFSHKWDGKHVGGTKKTKAHAKSSRNQVEKNVEARRRKALKNRDHHNGK